jgi:hypothetical protein
MRRPVCRVGADAGDRCTDTFGLPREFFEPARPTIPVHPMFVVEEPLVECSLFALYLDGTVCVVPFFTDFGCGEVFTNRFVGCAVVGV